MTDVSLIDIFLHFLSFLKCISKHLYKITMAAYPTKEISKMEDTNKKHRTLGSFIKKFWLQSTKIYLMVKFINKCSSDVCLSSIIILGLGSAPILVTRCFTIFRSPCCAAKIRGGPWISLDCLRVMLWLTLACSLVTKWSTSSKLRSLMQAASALSLNV